MDRPAVAVSEVPELRAAYEAESAAVERIAELIDRDDLLDVIAGSAGCIGSLLNLYQWRPAKRILDAPDVRGAARQHLVGAGHGQKVRKAAPIETGPGEVLGNESRLEAVDEPLEGLKMVGIGFGGPGKGHADAGKRDFAPAAQLFEHRQARTACDHVVLGVNLEPKFRRRRGQSLTVMLGLKAYAGGGNHGVTGRSG